MCSIFVGSIYKFFHWNLHDKKVYRNTISDVFLKNDKWCWTVGPSSIYVLSIDLEKQISKMFTNISNRYCCSQIKSTLGCFSYCFNVSFIHQTCFWKEKIFELEFCNGLIQQDSSWFLPNLVNLSGGFYVVPVYGRIMRLLLFPVKFVIAAIKYKKLSKLLDVSRVLPHQEYLAMRVHIHKLHYSKLKSVLYLFYFLLTSLLELSRI